MKYMMLVYASTAGLNEAPPLDSGPADPDEDDSFPWLEEMIERGIRLDGDQVRPPREAATVRVRNGELMITDGPFIETKEALAGFDILECASRDEAVQVAAKHPVAAFGTIEVWPFWHG